MSLSVVKKIVGWLARLAVFPMLSVWVYVRLWAALAGEVPSETVQIIAMAVTAVILVLEGAFGLDAKLLTPWKPAWISLLAAVAPLLLGFYFDVSLSMPDRALPAVKWLPWDLKTLCHLGNAVVFAVIVLALLKAGRDVLPVGKVNWPQIIVIAICLNAATALYAFTAKTVYVWDNAGYWVIARNLAFDTEISAYDQIIQVLESTLTEDYNYLLAYPISLVMRVFGGGRGVFLCATANFYALPAMWGLTALGNSKKWSGLVVVGLFPMLGYTAMVGFVDVACCGMGIWAYLIYTSDRPSASRGILSGALLVFSFLCRRYFLFFAVSFLASALLVKLLYERKKWKDMLYLYGSFGVCAVAFALKFLLDKVFQQDYGELYSAYDLGLLSDFFFMCRYFGLALLILFLSAAFISLAQREDRRRVSFGLAQIIICFVAFIQVQSHGQQHLLLYLPGLAFIAVYAMARAPQYISALLSMSMAIYLFFPKIQPLSANDMTSAPFFPSFHMYAPRRSDIDELLRLADYLDHLSAIEEKTVSVLASSFTFNTETISSLRSSLNMPEPEVKSVIQYHATVDKRDPFNWNTAFSDYLVVGYPVQVHLGQDNQMIMGILARHVMMGTGPGKAYRRLAPTFQLADGVEVRIYKRTRDWYLEEYHDISDPLVERYPEYKELYEVPKWLK